MPKLSVHYISHGARCYNLYIRKYYIILIFTYHDVVLLLHLDEHENDILMWCISCGVYHVLTKVTYIIFIYIILNMLINLIFYNLFLHRCICCCKNVSFGFSHDDCSLMY